MPNKGDKFRAELQKTGHIPVTDDEREAFRARRKRAAEKRDEILGSK